MKPSNCNQPSDAARPKCPLCGSLNTLCESQVGTSSIVMLYGKSQRDLVREELRGTSCVSLYRCQECSLGFFEPKLPGSPAYYASFQSLDWYYMESKAEYDIAAKWIAPNARVLEVGCGFGAFSKKIPLSEYTGLEYSDAAASVARDRGLDVRTQSVEEHALAHRSAYQVVCAFQVLEHVSDVAPFVAACLDCLEPGGKLIYAVPSGDSYIQFGQNEMLDLPPHHLTRWPDKTLETFPKIFSVSTIAIEHEALADMHVRAFVKILIRRRLNAILGRTEALVDYSLSAKIVRRVSFILSGWMWRMFDNAASRPNGNCVIAIYQKKGAGNNIASSGSNQEDTLVENVGKSDASM